jgi:hypothetical protein
VAADRVAREGQEDRRERRDGAERPGELDRSAEHVDQDGDAKLAARHAEHAGDPADRDATADSEDESAGRVVVKVQVREVKERLVEEQQANGEEVEPHGSRKVGVAGAVR